MEVSVRGMYIRAKRRRYIILNSEIHWQWRRFVCAHELGHDRLHRDIRGCHVDDEDSIRIGRMEFEANLFATHLLTLEGVEQSGVLTEILMDAIYRRSTDRLAHVVRDQAGEYG
ncbi:MAG TPA: ImmA/IrrE family metallo-endopeptidase [Alicyclobacillus sp.]|nr:ImmA/IrrE family metallo-endopeptidase [Alicyclobacillus sp.]